jgi:hypothetical protein
MNFWKSFKEGSFNFLSLNCIQVYFPQHLLYLSSPTSGSALRDGGGLTVVATQLPLGGQLPNDSASQQFCSGFPRIPTLCGYSAKMLAELHEL